jgi:CBS domain-containing protein
MGSIRDVMTENPTTCESSATILAAAKVLRDQNVGSVPVVDGGRLKGIVTDRDIVTRVVAEGRDPGSTAIGEVASSDLVTLTPDSNVDEALRLMAQKQVRRVPVTEGDRLVGIVAQADVARVAEEEKTGEVVQDISR